MKVPIIGHSNNGGDPSGILTGKISKPPDENPYPEDGMMAIQFKIKDKTYLGIAAEEGKFPMDLCLRVMKIIERG